MAKIRSRISRENEKFIMDHANQMTVEELAAKLNTHIKTVQSVIDVYGNIPEQNILWKQELRRSAAWKQIKNQFTPDELDYFEDEYVKLMEQFKQGEIVSTERTQVFQLIKIEIMMDRNLESKKKNRQQVELLQNLEKSIIDKYHGNFAEMPPEESTRISEIGQQIAGFVSAEQNSTKEYTDLQKQHNDILKMLKGDRERRVTSVENSKVSFTGLVKMLMEKDFQQSESRQNQLFIKATDKEFKRLAAPHKYIDGSIDLPILSAESIANYEKTEQEEIKEEEDKEE